MKRYLVSWSVKQSDAPKTIEVTAWNVRDAVRKAQQQHGCKKWFIRGIDELSDKRCDFCDEYAVEPTDVLCLCNDCWENWGISIGAHYGQY